MGLQLRTWYSSGGEVLIAMSPETTQQVENFFATLPQAWVIPPAIMQLKDGLKMALREVPPEKR